MRKTFPILLVLAFVANLYAQNIPEKPNPARFVNDFGQILSEDQEYSLESKLVNYQDTTSNQIAIVTIKSLEGYDIESYAYSLASKWGIGQKSKNNGILILLAIQEHKVRIEVGYGLEGVVPDAAAKQIIRDVLAPNFKQGNYYQGLDTGVDYIIRYASGEYKADPKQHKRGGHSALIFIVIVALIILFSFISKVNRVRSGHIGGPLNLWTILALLASSNRGNRGGGGFGGGSSGGSGWDFGGGSFGGGGSSGDW